MRALYRGLDDIVERARRELSTSGCARQDLPVRVANLSSIWTICYTQPSRYNWMFQYYLRAAGLALSWVGTGRLIFSLNYTDADFAAVADRSLSAARGDAGATAGGGRSPPLTNKAIRRRVLKEMLQARSPFGRRLDQLAAHAGKAATCSRA